MGLSHGSKENNQDILPDNNSHRVLVFESLRELREYAERHGYRIRRSPLNERCYYTESYVRLPLFDDD